MKKGEGQNTNAEHTPDGDLTIVGIGTSAGGLEALEVFMTKVPANSGIAFIVIQHMDQSRRGILVELLQRVTPMKVIQLNEGTVVQPDCVYVIPPNKQLSILHRALHLSEHVLPRGHQLPIDFFFRSLAEDQQEKSIGVILSGMGTDGTVGARCIKEKGGVVLVQEPSSAKYDGMPRSAFDAGLADIVSPVEDLPDKIIAYLKHKPLIDSSVPDLAETKNAFDKIVILLRSKTGHDFSNYKGTTIYRRIQRRMSIHQVDDIETYVSYLKEDPQELELLFNELLIGVTTFFREPAEWELLKDKVIPALLAERSHSQTLRAWVSACATGEEAYSLAIVFKEVMEELKPSHNFTLQIFATDLDRHAINRAREAIFPAGIAAEVSQERLNRYFVQVDQGYQVAKPIRDMVIFAPQNIIMDPPFTRLDILCCRNLLIYLTVDLQKRLLPLFHYCINPGGFLFLGSAETIISYTELFKPLHNESRLYCRLNAPLQAESVRFPASFAPVQASAPQPSKPAQNIQLLADQLILQYHSPPTVLVNNKGDILYITGRTGNYLEPAAGKANWNIFAMAREGIRYQLYNTFQKALRQKTVVTIKNTVLGFNGESQIMDIVVQPLEEPESLRSMVMIIFKDVPQLPQAENTTAVSPPNSTQREAELERELLQARQEIQVNRAEMQASQEELKSFNEELQSTNEELQSTNEELTTSKEELQSLNEELQAVNYELQTKVDELSVLNSDMKNLLDSTKIATLFLDNALCIRRFTSQMSVITKLIPGDVGRPVTDIASDLLYPNLAEDVQEVLQTMTTIENQVVSSNNHWFDVRILPYRTLEGEVDGVVVTFVDINEYKLLEAKLLETQGALEARLSDQNVELTHVRDKLQDEIKRGKKEAAAAKTKNEDKKKKNQR